MSLSWNYDFVFTNLLKNEADYYDLFHTDKSLYLTLIMRYNKEKLASDD